MFDHVTLSVRHLQTSKAFYEKALAPLGITPLYTEEFAVGFGKTRPQFWIGAADAQHPHSGPTHVAFACASPEEVRAFYDAALAAGAKDNGAPGFRPEYHEKYYGAFILDPDGNNIEAVTGNDV